jgi:hypothetical protein
LCSASSPAMVRTGIRPGNRRRGRRWTTTWNSRCPPDIAAAGPGASAGRTRTVLCLDRRSTGSRSATRSW